MAGTSHPSSSSNPPQGSQIMPRKIRDCLTKNEEEIKELEDVWKLKETEKRQIQRSIDEKKAMIASTNKDIRKEQRQLKALDDEFSMLDIQLKDKYIIVAQLKALYPEDS